MSLRSTINQIQARDSDLLAISDDKDEFLAAWRSDILALFDQIKKILKEYEDDGSIKFHVKKRAVKEEETGEYDAPELQIQIASRVIVCIPVARFTVGGAGRIDLVRKDRPAEYERVRIVRTLRHKEIGPWMIERRSVQQDHPINKLTAGLTTIANLGISRGERQYDPLNKEAIEDALDYLLRTP